jgi:uncharacterized protein YpuA (DUF1002 family)
MMSIYTPKEVANVAMDIVLKEGIARLEHDKEFIRKIENTLQEAGYFKVNITDAQKRHIAKAMLKDVTRWHESRRKYMAESRGHKNW